MKAKLNAYMHKLFFFFNLREAIIKANFSERTITQEINKIYNKLPTTNSVRYLQIIAKTIKTMYRILKVL